MSNSSCQAAREYGTIFHDDFLQWCFMEGHYTPFQVLMDLALLAVCLAAGVAIIGYYVLVVRSGRRKPAEDD